MARTIARLRGRRATRRRRGWRRWHQGPRGLRGSSQGARREDRGARGRDCGSGHERREAAHRDGRAAPPGEEQRIGFELQIAGTRNVKAARALLSNYDDDIEKLKAAKPWLFEAGTPAPAQTGAMGLGGYTRNMGYKTGSITYEFETKTFNYDRGIRLLADVMDVEEAGVLDCFVAAGSELQRTQVAPEADAFTFSEIAGHEGVTPVEEDFSDADAEDVLASLYAKRNTRK